MFCCDGWLIDWLIDGCRVGCRLAAEDALVAAAAREDDMENRRILEERRAEARGAAAMKVAMCSAVAWLTLPTDAMFLCGCVCVCVQGPRPTMTGGLHGKLPAVQSVAIAVSRPGKTDASTGSGAAKAGGKDKGSETSRSVVLSPTSGDGKERRLSWNSKVSWP